MRLRRTCVVLVVLALVAGCTGDDSSESPDASTTTVPEGASRGSLFAQGCPSADGALARQLDDSAAPMDGPRAVGGPGDLLLANDVAAFVVSAPVTEETPQRTWYEYGGIVVDAAPVAGCEQVGPDQVDEIGLVVGTLQLDDFTSSILRSFRADQVEVINDGSDGAAAVVRATGSDERFNLIEYQLIRAAGEEGKVKPLSEPFGLRIEVDYVLEPGDPVLGITLRIEAEADGAQSFLGAALVTWGDALTLASRPESTLDVAGMGLDLGVPWQVAQGDAGSYAFAAAEASQAIAAISGVNAFIDVDQALTTPMTVEQAGDTAEMSFLLAVSPTHANAATAALLARDPQLGPGDATTLPVAGTTVDPDGEPVGDVDIEVQMRRGGGEWATYDTAATDADGAFDTSVAVLADAEGAAPEVRLRFVAPGRAPVEVELDLADDAAPLSSEAVELGPAGSLDVTVTDEAGAALPARVTLVRDGEVVDSLDVAEAGPQPVVPGTYDVVVSRGYEYDRVEAEVVVPEGGTAPLEVQLVRTVDTSDWIAIDTHVHAAPSTDSDVLPERRYLDAAVTGVEVVVNTNHEVIEDLGAALESSGLGAWVTALTGQEVTASSPEHTTMYPVTPDDSVRGGPVAWYGLSLAEIAAAERERGAAIRGLNHPSSYLELIGWDPVTSTASLTDARILGLAPDAEVWSWDFEQVELQNGLQPVLRSDADGEGLFDFWQGAFNHGRRITGVAASDAHGIDLGDVVTYIRVPDDAPARVTPEQIVEAVRAGRAVLSTGAFAEVDIGGAGPGDLAEVAPGTVDVALRVQAAAGINVTTVMVFANCDLVATVAVGAGSGAVRFDDVIPVDLDADANITVLGFGSAALPRPFHAADARRVPRFTTNPVFVDVDGNGEFDPPGDKACAYPRS